MSTNCRSCGKMMGKPEDFSGGNESSQYCANCTNTDGSLKSLDEITLDIANQLIMSQGIDREAATKAARSILSVQSEWKIMLSKQDARKTRKQKIMLILITAVVTIGAILGGWFVSNIKLPEKELFETIKPVVTTTKSGDLVVTQVSFPGNQSQVVIDKNDSSINFSNGSYPYRFEIDKVGEGSSSIPFSEQVQQSNAFLDSTVFVASFTSGSNGKTSLFEGPSPYFSLDGNENLFVSHEDQEFLNESIGIVKNRSFYFTPGYLSVSVYQPIIHNIVTTSKYAAWISNYDNSFNNSSIMVYNSRTQKTTRLPLTSGKMQNIQTNVNSIFWEDFSDINVDGFVIKGFDLDTMKPINTPLKRKNSLNDHNMFNYDMSTFGANYGSVWRVAGENIVLCDFQPVSKFTVFNYKTNQIQTVEKDVAVALTEKFENKLGDNILYRDYLVGGMMNCTRLGKRDKIVWLTKNAKGQFDFAISDPSSINDNPMLIETNKGNLDYLDYVGSSGYWIIWKSRKLDKTEFNRFSTYTINATNIVSGEQIEVGKYCEDCYENKNDITVQKGIIAWSSVTDNGDTDIFFAKLPKTQTLIN